MMVGIKELRAEIRHLRAANRVLLGAIKIAIKRADANLAKYYRARAPQCQRDYDRCVAAIAMAEGRAPKSGKRPRK